MDADRVVERDNLVLANIGNTHTQIALVENGLPVKLKSVPTETLHISDFPEGCQLAAASVVPKIAERLAPLVPFWIGCRKKTGILWDGYDISTLGADRIANAVMLGCGSLPAVCIDFGTAITFEIVDDSSRFLGGAIAPGRRLMRNALHDYTAQLPLIGFFPDLPEDFGNTTVNAMRCGVDGGSVAMISGMIADLRMRLGANTRFVAVGGDSVFFRKHIDGLEAGGENFTLQGILKCWELDHES